MCGLWVSGSGWGCRDWTTFRFGCTIQTGVHTVPPTESLWTVIRMAAHTVLPRVSLRTMIRMGVRTALPRVLYARDCCILGVGVRGFHVLGLSVGRGASCSSGSGFLRQGVVVPSAACAWLEVTLLSWLQAPVSGLGWGVAVGGWFSELLRGWLWWW